MKIIPREKGDTRRGERKIALLPIASKFGPQEVFSQLHVIA